MSKEVVSINQITSREGVLKNYLKEIHKYELLTDNQVNRLCEIIQSGDEINAIKARNELVQGNLRFVISVAKQYKSNEIHFPDLINEGNIGLLKAAMQYNSSTNNKFLTYAVWWVRKQILEFIGEDKMIRIPNNRAAAISKINKLVITSKNTLGVNPTEEEMLKIKDISQGDIDIYKIKDRLNPISLSKELDGEDSSTIGELVACDDKTLTEEYVESEYMKKMIKSLLSCLREKDQIIMKQLFGIDCDEMSVDATAKFHNLTPERIRQIKDSSLVKMRKKITV